MPALIKFHGYNPTTAKEIFIMHKSALIALLYLGAVTANDIRLGVTSPNSRKIYSEIKEANPALWTRTDDIIVNAVDSEIISAIYVTDLRDDKDGEAYIESGGVGDKSVTIGLRSPSVLRGYKFEIEVYGTSPSSGLYQNSYKGQYTKGGAYVYEGQYGRKI